MSHPAQELGSALGDRYRIEREIGQGGMATVFLAHDVRHQRQVAIKVLRPAIAETIGADRFLREILLAAKLQHPNVLTLIDSGEAGGFLYYVMPFVEGDTLRKELGQRGGRFAPLEVTRILRDVIEAIAYAHRHGVVHRDIKPDNVMLTDRHALVLDFGIAKAIGDSASPAHQTTTGIAIGTPAYMAPEQLAADRGADHRVDIYAIGVLARELLTGDPRLSPAGAQLEPLAGSSWKAAGTETVDVPAPLVSIMERCLQKDPAARYQTADDLLAEIEALLSSPERLTGAAPRPGVRLTRGWIGIGIGLVVVLVLGWLTYSGSSQRRRERSVRERDIPAVSRLVGASALDSAWVVAEQASRVLPTDPVLEQFWADYFAIGVLQTNPSGAKVYIAPYSDTTHWRLLGVTPTDSIRLPGWPVRLRVEKAGFRDGERGGTWEGSLVLDSLTAPRPEMVRVDGGVFAPSLPGLGHLEALQLSEFLIDRDEVTNREYQIFVDSGGYTKREYWESHFVKAGRRLPWDEGIALFKDRTGRPGPTTWQGGHAPSGMEDYPVGGVSWYEAAAYARFAGKSLPTVYHWVRAAEPNVGGWIVPGSTFNSQGPTRRNRLHGMSPFGTFDLAGNVREWCLNSAGGLRYILGGGWNDESYMFNIAYAQEPFDRSPTNGIRLVIYPSDEPAVRTAMKPIERPRRDYSIERPVSEVVFESYRRLYDYDRGPLGPKVEARDTAERWIMERVSIAAAYGGERLQVYLFLPKAHRQPFQAVVFFPGKGAVEIPAFAGDANAAYLDFLLNSGRALVYPVYKSTYERKDSLTNAYPDQSIFYRDHVVMWAKDLRRSIDYIVTRTDIDSSRIAYLGVSWGAALGGIMPAVESRFKAVILDRGGLFMEQARPEADQINFLPRIVMPVLMLNGTYDNLFPNETSQRPFFGLLGTPAMHKRLVMYEGGHFLSPRDRLIGESLAWLDKYLGPVR